MTRKTILITGGAGFIGSHVVRLFTEKYSDCMIVNLDALTYAGNLDNLRDVQSRQNYRFEQVNLLDSRMLERVFRGYSVTDVIHLAAESHVDRSIESPMDFVYTNVIGTVNLLEAARNYWKGEYEKHLFYHISTDEVYGALGEEGFFTETTPYHPNSPYSASKASSDHFVRAYAETYGMRTLISNCSNNYGPNQFPEKLIPLFISNIMEKRPLPVYGDGLNTRDWLFVKDHALAIDLLFHSGKHNETYNIGGFNEWKNIDLVKLLCELMDQKLGREEGESQKLISYIRDRPGHDLRYAIDATKINSELSWNPTVTFEEGLSQTIDWYLQNSEWLENIKSGRYRQSFAESI